MRLTQELWAVGLHPITGADTEEGTLPVGTRIRFVERVKAPDGDVWFFDASTDDGAHWYAQRAFEAPSYR